MSWQTRWQEAALAVAQSESREPDRLGSTELVDYVADTIDGHHRVIRLHLDELAEHLSVARTLLTCGMTVLQRAGFLAPLGEPHKWLAVNRAETRRISRRRSDRWAEL